jgi:16S rRNA (uracil1498-N3)-methyltransferase
MPVFFTRNISGGEAVLNEEESRHAIRVLRLKQGDVLEFVDGLGGRYKALIRDADPSGTRISILETSRDFLSRNIHLHIGIAPTKNTERFEWFLEKATEIGIEEITPIICDHSERKKLRLERSEKILISAMKQSGRAFLPVLNPIRQVAEFLESEDADLKYIAHCRTDEGQLPAKPLKSKTSLIILIGPEGDFSPQEVDLARKKMYQELKLGQATYRTETAGIMACMLVNYLSGV